MSQSEEVWNNLQEDKLCSCYSSEFLVGKSQERKWLFRVQPIRAVCEVIADTAMFRNHAEGDSKAIIPFEIPRQSNIVFEPSVELHLRFYELT